MVPNVLSRVNDRRLTFDFEESYKYCGGNKYYLLTSLIETDEVSDIIETLLLFQKERINAFYHFDLNAIIHEYSI